MKTVLIGVIAALCLSACTVYEDPILDPFPTFPSDMEKIDFPLPHGTVNEADSDYYFIQNKIEIKDTDAPEATVNGTIIRFPVYTIDGLIDQNVEDTINTKIADKIQALKAYADFALIPVRPGFYAAYSASMRKVKGLVIYVNAYFNSNNILSLMFTTQVFISRNINTYDPDLSLYDTLNIDLNTGDDLVLSDLFVNGSDWEAILNERILMKSQHRIDPLSGELTMFDPAYEYLGGFEGINGDLRFMLNSVYNGTIAFVFSDNDTHFRNGFSTVQIEIPMKDLKDILAFGQRFTLDKPYLFTKNDPTKIQNYLYPASYVQESKTIGSILVYSEITYDDTLSETFQALRTTLLKQETDYILSLKNSGIKSLYWMFWARPEGPYMRVTSVMNLGDQKHILSGTYLEDGHKLTMDDIYADGYDYRAYYIDLIKKDLEYNAEMLDKEYDPDEVFDALAPTVYLYSVDNTCRVGISNDFIFDAAWDPGEFSFRQMITDDPAIFKIKPWFTGN